MDQHSLLNQLDLLFLYLQSILLDLSLLLHLYLRSILLDPDHLLTLLDLVIQLHLLDPLVLRLPLLLLDQFHQLHQLRPSYQWVPVLQ